jgi:long-chain acyl-CoA synthetase
MNHNQGVIVLHRNLSAIVAGFNEAVGGLTEKDIHLGFLPLAHILELAAEISFLIIGGKIAYGNPR